MEEQQTTRRPAWVWVFTFFFVISGIWTLLSLILTLGGATSMSAAQRTYLESLTFFDVALSTLIGLATLVGAVLLFLLKRAAFYFFVGSFLLNLLVSIRDGVSKSYGQAVGSNGLIGVLIGLAILAAACLYSRRLTRRGVLS